MFQNGISIRKLTTFFILSSPDECLPYINLFFITFIFVSFIFPDETFRWKNEISKFIFWVHLCRGSPQKSFAFRIIFSFRWVFLTKTLLVEKLSYLKWPEAILKQNRLLGFRSLSSSLAIHKHQDLVIWDFHTKRWSGANHWQNLAIILW